MANIVDGAVLDRELNPEQAAAAKKIDGPMLILAGAGSGKTRCITYKIAHLVSQHGVEADRILAVTFTNKAAREMKSRIQKLLDCNMNFSWMGTFHSVCLRLLKLCLSKESVVAAMGGQWYDGNFSIYDDDDQKRILKEILKEDLGDNFEASEVKKLHAAISKYKNSVLKKGSLAQLQTPDVVMQLATYPDELKNAEYYSQYQKRLKESNAMDFDDLLFNTVYMLQKIPKLAEQLAYRFRYVVVDEYQDTNDVQYELLKLLINEKKNVTVVGDDDQSIYGWRGANIDIIRNFHRDFAPVTIVKLERNYRSTANIVKGAGSVIAHNIRPQEMQKNVFSKEDAGELIHVRQFIANDDPGQRFVLPLESAEANAIADTIAKAGPDFYAKTAVFYRTNAQSRALEKALNDRRIPSVIFGGMRFWDRKEIKDVLAYLRLLANERDDAAHLRVINTPPRAIGKTTVENILERERNGEGSFWENLLAEANSVGRTAPKLKGFTDMVLSWKALVAAGETPLPILAERIINDVGYKEFLRKEDEVTADERIGNLDEMVNAIREFDEEHPGATLDAFLQDISLLTDADKKVDNSKGQVTLMTIHMAKGLEFNTVHIAGCDQGIFPLVRSSSMMTTSEMNEQIEEERRLFYVGCTRAEKKLYLYHIDGRFFQGSSQRFAKSKFLSEMDPSVVDENVRHLGGSSFGGDDFNQDFSGQQFSRPPRPNIPPSFPHRPSGSFGGSSSRPNNFGSHGFSRPSIPNSVKKNDKRIVYRNPIKVAAPPKPAEPSGPRVVFDEFSENPFHPGVRVRHSKYGVGTIVKCYGSGDNARVDVRFGNDPTIRTIILKYAALQIVG
ncbi:ATP-dependent helicase [Fibrobacter sp. UWH4]|uniref:ATP-dependent helicase n=1 Tax=Fibrobacter sp. UWH4 TaxID=1896210 RepID=UPI000918A079|nr:UvrD-helicase domain-containing protein [Fibrobacter sp. UWH4]SHK78573.1 DNA helicase-2 / ATP-dependent DNA helicase PcrA [Fibrobacter sp. UWH4]